MVSSQAISGPGRPVLPGPFFRSAAFAAILSLWAALFFVSPGQARAAWFSFGQPKIGVVKLEGLIADPEKLCAFIETLRKDRSVKGVILRINSGGGGVAASQEIFRAVSGLVKAKPVVVSMGSAAASGGYYAACPATRIFANPGTVTASIGVRMELANLEGLMDKIGWRQESLTSGKFKGSGSPFRTMTEEEREYFRAVVMDMHEQFVADVAASRKMDPDKVRAVADGRIMTGRQALTAGLVDELGGLAEARAYLLKICDIQGEPEVVVGPKKDIPWWTSLLSLAGIVPEGAVMPSTEPTFR